MGVKVYVSYSWEAEEDSRIVARLEDVLAGTGIQLLRDIRKLGYGQSIRQFMDEIGAADQVVLVLSDAYFRSPYCMYELRAVHGQPDFRARAHPVVLAGSRIHDPLWWVDVLEHWEQQGNTLEEKLRTISRRNTSSLQRVLDDYTGFRGLVDLQLATLADMNALTEGIHRDTDFKDMIARIRARAGTGIHRDTPKQPEPPHVPKPPPAVAPAVQAVPPTPFWAERVDVDAKGAFVSVEWLGATYRLDWDARHNIWWGPGPLAVDEHGLFAEASVKGVIQGFRWIPPGEFWMGSPEGEAEREDDEGPRHRVRLSKGFWLADTACSQALWQAMMGNNPSAFTGNASLPVEQVSWDDVDAFLRRLEAMLPGAVASLPTEAEWEYACRAGTETPFSFGAEITPERANYDGNYAYDGGPTGAYREKTLPVRSFAPNPWGLYQMHGNVYEWCADGLRDYSAAPRVDPWGPTGQEKDAPRALRGGSWSCRPGWLRSAPISVPHHPR